MDVSLKPKLEYLHAYKVKKVLIAKDDVGWAIEFENGAIVANKDASLLAPTDEIIGMPLITTIFAPGDTTLRFGRVTVLPDQTSRVDDEIMVELNPTEYTIIDPRFEGEDEHYPQRAAQNDVADLDTIRSEFDARAAEAPQTDEERIAEQNGAPPDPDV